MQISEIKKISVMKQKVISIMGGIMLLAGPVMRGATVYGMKMLHLRLAAVFFYSYLLANWLVGLSLRLSACLLN